MADGLLAAAAVHHFPGHPVQAVKAAVVREIRVRLEAQSQGFMALAVAVAAGVVQAAPAAPAS